MDNSAYEINTPFHVNTVFWACAVCRWTARHVGSTRVQLRTKHDVNKKISQIKGRHKPYKAFTAVRLWFVNKERPAMYNRPAKNTTLDEL